MKLNLFFNRHAQNQLNDCYATILRLFLFVGVFKEMKIFTDV
jgi:hypothetical protein